MISKGNSGNSDFLLFLRQSNAKTNTVLQLITACWFTGLLLFKMFLIVFDMAELNSSRDDGSAIRKERQGNHGPDKRPFQEGH